MNLDRYVLLLLCIGVLANGCQRNNGAQHTAIRNEANKTEVVTDEKWPHPKVLRDYRDVLSMYKSGKSEDAQRLLAKLAVQPLRIAPDTALGNQHDYALYIADHLGPTLSLLRHVACQNELYARSLASKGDFMAALDVLATNLELARQMIHIKPTDCSALISGTIEWRSASLATQDLLEKVGKKEESMAVARCVRNGERFFDERIQPFVEKGIQEQEELTLDSENAETVRKVSESYQKRSVDLQSLIAEWDREVDVAPCNGLSAD